MELFSIWAGILSVYTGRLYLFFFIICFSVAQKRLLWMIIFFSAQGYAYFHQWWVETALPMPVHHSVITEVSGTVQSIFVQKKDKLRFKLNVQAVNHKKAKGILLLSWYRPKKTLKTGQKWYFKAKLKKPRNLNNPGGFNYVRFLRARHILWTGYVVHNQAQLLSNSKQKNDVASIRQYFKETLSTKIKDRQTAGLIQALTLGLTSQIDSTLWDLFRRTGTTHLMVISGAHIGFIAGLIFFLTSWLWRQSPYLCLRWPALKAGSIAGFTAALIYTVLSGLAVPAQRALIGCAFCMLQHLGSKKYSIWQVWRYSLFTVVFFEPHSVLLPGFYLSFLAVAIIILACQRWPCRGVKKMLLIQASCVIGLFPFTLYWFSYGSITGFIANLVAVPFIGFIIVPLAMALLLVISYDWADRYIVLLTSLLHKFIDFLQWIDQFSFINSAYSFSSIIMPIIFFAAGLIWIVLPVTAIRVPVALIAISSLFLEQAPIREHTANIHILDVGQGLSVVVQTKHHILIYDTGDRFYKGRDMADMAILPFLKTKRINGIDKLVLSHADKDHIGGANTLINSLFVKEFIVNDPDFFQKGISCHQYPSWNWDGIDFRFFSVNNRFPKKNNRSCVLQISDSHHRILLTGDIEQKAERYLMSHYGRQLKSDVLLVPHHGSKTSSSRGFLELLRPSYAIASLGDGNRFHFPHEEVVRRYGLLNIPLILTSKCGMVTVKLGGRGELSKPECFHLGDVV